MEAARRPFAHRARALLGKISTPWRPDALHDYMHAKVTVADDLVFLGSYNLSNSGQQNAENVLEIVDAELADRMARFIDDLRGATRRWNCRPMFGLSRRRVLLILVILGVACLAGALSLAGGPYLATFGVSTLALAGLAWLVSLATEAIGEHFGPAVTGVLQSTLGNLPELFVVFFALRAGELVVAADASSGRCSRTRCWSWAPSSSSALAARPTGVMRFHPRLPKDTRRCS